MAFAGASLGGQIERASLKGRTSGSEKSAKPIIFLILLWLALLAAFTVLLVLIISTLIDGWSRLDLRLITNYPSANPEEAGLRPAIIGSIWVIVTVAVLTIPLGIAAAVHLEEFANKHNRFNRLVELNVQNLAAVPSIVYGLLALGALTAIGVKDKNIVLGGAVALGMLVLPVLVIATREALRSVPMEIREGSLAVGATPLQTMWRQTLPSAVPGIATGSILALSRALGEAAPLLVLGALVYLRFDPNGLLSGYTTMPIQIFNWTSRPQEAFAVLASASSILLLVILLAMNAVAIIIRNRYQRRW
jgi:phosphate transport system permease protein